MPHRPKPQSRQKHKVDLGLNARDITRAGSSLELSIYAEGERLGHLVIGSGSINWRGRNRRTSKRITLVAICRNDGPSGIW